MIRALPTPADRSFWGCRGFLSIRDQSAWLRFQQSPSISKAILTYLRQKELSVGGQIISL